MTAQGAAASALVALGVGVTLLSALGLLAVRDAFDRLHLPGPAAAVGALSVALALLAFEGPRSPLTLRGFLIAGLLTVTGPVVCHATARAEWLRLSVGGDDPPAGGGPSPP